MANIFYEVVDGQTISETLNASSREYISDALGSVIGLMVEQSMVEEYRYMPYGRQLSGPARSGLGWLGKWGVWTSAEGGSNIYMRSRYYSAGMGSFLTTDLRDTVSEQYNYARCNPTNFVDPLGLKPLLDPKCSKAGDPAKCCEDFGKFFQAGLPKKEFVDKIMKCLEGSGISRVFVEHLLKFKNQWCNTEEKRQVCIVCNDSLKSMPEGCDPCSDKDTVAVAIGSDETDDEGIRDYPLDCKWTFEFGHPECKDLHDSKKCDCTVFICQMDFVQGKGGKGGKGFSNFCDVMLHEMDHCTGWMHQEWPTSPVGHKDSLFRIQCCMCKAMGNEPCASCENIGI